MNDLMKLYKKVLNEEEKKEDVAIYPDQVFDLHGVFSGTTFIENNKMHCYYTGTVKRQGYNDNYEIEGMEQNTILVTSEDGFNFSDKKLLHLER